MTHYPAPKLLADQCFRDIDELSRLTGWDLEFRQIDSGPLVARVLGFGHADIRVMRVEFDRSYHQIGQPPPGVLTFGMPDIASGTLQWNGVETPPGVLINFNYEKMLDCVSHNPFGAFVFSFKEEVLQSACEKLGFDSKLLETSKSNRFWSPEGDEHDQLRQMLFALEKVASTDGDEGLKKWTDVFNSDLATLIVRIISTDKLATNIGARKFRVEAMNRAVKILSDYEHFPPSVEALCTLAGASWATLGRAFKEEFGVTPKSYIKSRRLAAVQSELCGKESNLVISDIANRWGFWHMGSFAADYRKQFDELPSDTLRRRHVKKS
jgi:AraC family ethanolamine operon transcriptional activator